MKWIEVPELRNFSVVKFLSKSNSVPENWNFFTTLSISSPFALNSPLIQLSEVHLRGRMFASCHERPFYFYDHFFRCCSTDGPIRAGDAGSYEIACPQCLGRESPAFGLFGWDRRCCSRSLKRHRLSNNRRLPRPQIFCPTICPECCRFPDPLPLRLLKEFPRRIQGIPK